jgi:hypothetical protein
VTKFRGYEIEQVGRGYVFTDTGLSVPETWKSRPCGSCNRANTHEGHDACLGRLSRVWNACCGHGSDDEAYVQFDNGADLRGTEAVRHFAALGVGPALASQEA